MLIAFLIGLFFSILLSIEIVAWKPKHDGTQVDIEAVRAFRALSVISTVAIVAWAIVRNWHLT